MGWGAASSTATVRGAGGMAVLGRVPSGRRQVAQAELRQDLECHLARLRRTPAVSELEQTTLPWLVMDVSEGAKRLGALAHVP